MMDIKEFLLQWFMYSLIKKPLLTVLKMRIFQKIQLKNYTKPIVRNIWGADLADMQLISKFSKGICILLCVIDIYGKYAWIIPLKDKKVFQLLMLFKKSQLNRTLAKLSPKDVNQIKYGFIKAVSFTID